MVPGFIKTFWGQKPEKITLETLKLDGFDGLEVNVCSVGTRCAEIVAVLKDNGYKFIAQQWLPPAVENAEQYIEKLKQNLENIAGFKPVFINSHTGKDHFSFDDNCKIIEITNQFTRGTGIPVYHETHRGRFAFHLATTLRYLDAFPDLQFTADFSHWCTVSESMLKDQQAAIVKILPWVKYIHARIGYEHSPQVNDPDAPEWQQHVDQFFNWWDKIIDFQGSSGDQLLICPEFGPVPYMPTEPFTKKPLSDQDTVNLWMLSKLKDRYLKK